MLTKYFEAVLASEINGNKLGITVLQIMIVANIRTTLQRSDDE